MAILGLLKRLSFHPSNFNAYIGLIIILTLIATAGIFSFVTQADLVHDGERHVAGANL